MARTYSDLEKLANQFSDITATNTSVHVYDEENRPYPVKNAEKMSHRLSLDQIERLGDALEYGTVRDVDKVKREVAAETLEQYVDIHGPRTITAQNFKTQEERQFIRLDRDLTMYKEDGAHNLKAGSYLDVTDKENIVGMTEDEFRGIFVKTKTNTYDVLANAAIALNVQGERNFSNKLYQKEEYPDRKQEIKQEYETFNAKSTEEFINLMQEMVTPGKELHGHFTNIDFKEVEDRLKEQGLAMPKFSDEMLLKAYSYGGNCVFEGCDFRGCSEIEPPYNCTTMTKNCKTNETERIQKMFSSLEKDDFRVSVSITPDAKAKVDILDKDNNYIWSVRDNIKSPKGLENAHEELAPRVQMDERLLMEVREGKREMDEKTLNALNNRIKLFYSMPMEIDKKLTFENLKESQMFVQFLEERARILKRDNYNGDRAHWDDEEKTLKDIGAFMKNLPANYRKEQVEIMMNHPKMDIQRSIDIQREAWMNKQKNDMEESMKEIRRAQNKLETEQLNRDKRFFGLGKIWDRTVNRKSYEQRVARMRAMQSDYNGVKQSYEELQNKGSAEFDKRMMESFKNWKEWSKEHRSDDRTVMDLSMSKTQQKAKSMEM